MAAVTYLIRMLPLAMIKKKIKNRYVLSFLYYIPYTVLSVMTIPAVFSSSSYKLSAAAGFAAAIIAAYFEKSLVKVASLSCLAVFLTELLIQYV